MVVCAWGFYAFVVALAMVHVLINTSAQVKFQPDESSYVKVDGRNMFVRCSGEDQGQLPILFAHGLGGNSLDFSWMQRNLSQVTRTCSYDRAGYGRSRERGRLPRTSIQIAEEMAVIAEKVGFTNGFLAVGHSFGGYNLRILQNLYPSMVKGIVLVDPSHPNITTRGCEDDTGEELAIFHLGALGAESGVLDIVLQFPPVTGMFDLKIDNLPEDVHAEYLSNLMVPEFYKTYNDEAGVWGASCKAVRQLENIQLTIPFHIIVPTVSGGFVGNMKIAEDFAAKVSNQSSLIKVDDPTADHVSILEDEKLAQICIGTVLDVLNQL